MTDNLYARQIPLGLVVPPSITIAGIGGIGSWVAIFAAMSGVRTLYLFDPDLVEETNRNRLPFCEGSIGRPKVDVVREFIATLRPNATIVGIQEKLQDILLDIQLKVSNYIIDCTDSPKAQFTIYNACKKWRIPFIRAGYDGTRMTVTSAVTGWMKVDVEQENYTVNPSWVVPAATVAALAVGKILKFQNQEVSLDLGEIGIPALSINRRVTARCRERV